VKKYVQFSFWKSIISALVAALVQCVWYFGFLRVVPHTLVWLIPVGVSGVILYGLIVWLFEKKRITDTVASFRGSL
jgi:hypothetical protein